MPERTVFFVSDGTGITAETFGNSILAQFPAKPRHVRRPFIDTSRRRPRWSARSTRWPMREGKRPIVFITLVATRCAASSPPDCKGLVLDMFRTFVEPLEANSASRATTASGRFSDASQSQEYNDRIEAINFSLAHDDGQSRAQPGHCRRDPGGRQPQRQDAHQPVPGHAARHQGRQLPADPRRLRARPLPSPLAPHKRKCFGLTIDPDRLSQIRHERRPAASTRRWRTAATRSTRPSDDAPRRASPGCRRRTSRSRRSPPPSCATCGPTG
jgi:regulator of PEP synthase PpsR (kinase-PPPase family)